MLASTESVSSQSIGLRDSLGGLRHMQNSMMLAGEE
jgi:hypothetical protein